MIVRLPRGAWAFGLLVVACQPPRPAAVRTTDKAALYGDPTLVPTREGEAARRELALAAELERVLAATGWIDRVRVDVEVQGDTTIVVVGGARSPRAPFDLEPQVTGATHALVGPRANVTMLLGDADPPSEPRLQLPLALALLGLGASVALSLDRLWRRRRRITPRRGSRAPH